VTIVNSDGSREVPFILKEDKCGRIRLSLYNPIRKYTIVCANQGLSFQQTLGVTPHTTYYYLYQKTSVVYVFHLRRCVYLVQPVPYISQIRYCWNAFNQPTHQSIASLYCADAVTFDIKLSYI
jgi:hypothetical protein